MTYAELPTKPKPGVVLWCRECGAENTVEDEREGWEELMGLDAPVTCNVCEAPYVLVNKVVQYNPVTPEWAEQENAGGVG